MITINVITLNEVEYLKGKIGKTNYSIPFSEEAKQVLVDATAAFNKCSTREEADTLLAETAEKVLAYKSTKETNALTEVLEGDLAYNSKTNKYYLISDGKTSKKPIHKFFVDKMLEAADKGISPKPWLFFWVRLMRNDLFRKNSEKVAIITAYLKAQYVDTDAVKELVEDGYSEKMATKLSTFDQISITEEGILAAFKYVSLVDKKFIARKNEETGEQEIVEVDRYEKELDTVDDVTGEVIKKGEVALPKHAEEFKFLPPVMGTSGDAFTCNDLDDVSEELPTGHTVMVGKVHSLPKGFNQVDCNDGRAGVKGLHLGGYYYVQGFGGKTDYLVDCLVSPEDIGAVCDVRGTEPGDREGAIRCKRYMATGGHFAVGREMYHPSDYAALMDVEWKAYKDEVIAKLESKKVELEERL